jgi:hypothetical protein
MKVISEASYCVIEFPLSPQPSRLGIILSTLFLQELARDANFGMSRAEVHKDLQRLREAARCTDCRTTLMFEANLRFPRNVTMNGSDYATKRE